MGEVMIASNKGRVSFKSAFSCNLDTMSLKDFPKQNGISKDVSLMSIVKSFQLLSCLAYFTLTLTWRSHI